MSINYKSFFWMLYILVILLVWVVFADNCIPQFFKITAYYSPLSWQSYYAQNTYKDEVTLNGKGTHWAWGKKVFDGMIAAPSKYPFGTKIFLPGLWTGIVEDRWWAIISSSGGDRIDIRAWSWLAGLRRAYGIWPISITWYICSGDNDNTLDIWFEWPIYSYSYDDVLFWTINQSIGRNDIMVTKLQNILAKYWYMTLEYTNGKFDENTRLAVCNYQLSKNIITNVDQDCGVWWVKTRSYFKTDLFGNWIKTYIWDKKNSLTTKLLEYKPKIIDLDLSKNDGKSSSKIVVIKYIKTDKTDKSKSDKKNSQKNILAKIYFDKPIDMWTQNTKVSMLQDILIIQWIKVQKTNIMDNQTKDWIYKLQLQNSLITKSDNKNSRWYMWPGTRALLNKLYNS